jgi:glycosyltransferase involved in cell wall biosynthesis
MISRNILFFISSLNIGGAELHVLDLCRYLDGHGIRASVCILGQGGELAGRFEATGVTVYELGIGSLRDLVRPSIRKRIRGILSSARPDILHAHMFHAEIAAAVASVMSGVPLVVTRHSAGLEFNGPRRVLAALAGRRTRRVIAVSDEAAQEAARIGAAKDSIVVIPNGVDTSRFRPMEPALRYSEKARLVSENFPAGAGSECVLIGSLSGLKPVKDFPTLLKAFSGLLSSGGHDARLIVAGEGQSREELEGLVSSLGIGRSVSFPGHTDRPEEYLPLFDIFVLPSRSEGVPLALLEAMSCGVACVASRVGGMPGVLGDCGITFEPGDLKGLTEIMVRLAADTPARADIGRRARVRVMEFYSLELWGSRTNEVYEQLAGLRGKR